MKNTIKTIGFAVIAVIALTVCGNNNDGGKKTIVDITVTTQPDKIEYNIGEELNLTGMVVTAAYSDGSTQVVSDYTVSGFVSSTAGQKTVTVTYEDNSATFTVTVLPEAITIVGIAVTNSPNKTQYDTGEELNTVGLVITATYSDGSTLQVTGYTASGFDSSTAGEKTVTVTYNGKTATFTITVRQIVSITITTLPNKTVYGKGDTLDTYGLVVTAAYIDGLTQQITGYTTSGFNSSTEGEKTITVTYNSKSASFTVIVNDAFTSIAALITWLVAQPANTKTTAYNVKLNVGNLNGDYNTAGSAGNTLYTNKNKYVNLNLSGSTFTSIGADAFAGCYSIISVTISANVTSIGLDAFGGCENLTSVTIGSRVTSIEDFAFSDCYSLTSITIPNSVSKIDWGAFQGCTGLTRVIFQGTISRNDFHSYAFGYSGNTGYIGDLRNKYLAGGIGVYTRPNVGYDGTWTKTSDDVGSLPPAGGDYNSYAGFSYSVNGAVVTIHKYNGSGGAVIIPAQIDGKPVTSIEDSAFASCTGLTSVTIPNSVTEIWSSVFAGCTALSSVNIPNSVTLMRWGVFSGCTSLISVTIPDSVTSIEGYAFRDCTGLINVTIPNSVTSIGELAFKNCTSLTSVTIGNSVKKIGKFAFDGCTSLTSVTFQGTIPSSAFSDVYDIYTFPGNLRVKFYEEDEANGTPGTYTRMNGSSSHWAKNGKSFGDYFYSEVDGKITIVEYNGAGGDVTIPAQINGKPVTSIGQSAFYGCTSLTNVIIPDSVTSIEFIAFQECTSLISIMFQGTIPSSGIHVYAFYSLGNLRNAYLAGGIGTYTTNTPGDSEAKWTKQ